ncbi:hypothetical protein BGZ74_000873 [Mortierella antarctica]|nr:hypothetical protein BGZ74_000873 [Mortierella antarctica]
MVSSIASLNSRLNAARIAKELIKGIPAGLVISLNAWATILINSQPRWLFRKRRWSEGEMRAISCYYLVVAYLMLRVVRLASTLTKRPGRPYGDFFRNTRPILGQVAIFSLATMFLDEFIMFYILRKFGLEKKRILITGRPLDKDTEVSDDDCCICYGAMLGDDDGEQEEFMGSIQGDGMSKDTDHVLENFCVVKQHVAHRGCIRKWYNYGPKGHVHGDEEQNQQEAIAVETAEPVLRPLFPQQDEYTMARNAGRKTCPACRQQLVLNFVDLAKGRLEMSYVQKMQELVRDMTKFSDWRGLILRSLITAGWVGVTIVGGKLRIVAMDKALAKHQRNRVLATVSTMST